MCLFFFYSLFLFTLFIQAFSLSFWPSFPIRFFFPPRLSTSYHHFFYPPHGGTRC